MRLWSPSNFLFSLSFRLLLQRRKNEASHFSLFTHSLLRTWKRITRVRDLLLLCELKVRVRKWSVPFEMRMQSCCSGFLRRERAREWIKWGRKRVWKSCSWEFVRRYDTMIVWWSKKWILRSEREKIHSTSNCVCITCLLPECVLWSFSLSGSCEQRRHELWRFVIFYSHEI